MGYRFRYELMLVCDRGEAGCRLTQTWSGSNCGADVLLRIAREKGWKVETNRDNPNPNHHGFVHCPNCRKVRQRKTA